MKTFGIAIAALVLAADGTDQTARFTRDASETGGQEDTLPDVSAHLLSGMGARSFATMGHPSEHRFAAQAAKSSTSASVMLSFVVAMGVGVGALLADVQGEQKDGDTFSDQMTSKQL